MVSVTRCNRLEYEFYDFARLRYKCYSALYLVAIIAVGSAIVVEHYGIGYIDRIIAVLEQIYILRNTFAVGVAVGGSLLYTTEFYVG